MKLKPLFTAILMISASSLMAQIIHVPDDQPTIQAAIDESADGDTILVSEGLYYENIRFMGKAITVASEFLVDGDETHIENTVIDGSQATHPDTASTVMFINGEDTTSIITGFTITGGSGLHDGMYDVQFGGGIGVMNAGAKIEHNIITLNQVTDDFAAGGCGIGNVVYLGNTWLVVRHNVISHNSAYCDGLSAFGGGMNSTTNSIIQYNTIEYNNCTNLEGDQVDGGGIEIEYLSMGEVIFAEISHNIIKNNTLNVTNVAIGSGLIIARASANIHHNDISYNKVVSTHFGNGAGIYVFDNMGEVIIENNDIIGNDIDSEEWARGGAIALWEPPSQISILSNVIQDNTIDGTDNRGAGIWIRYPSGDMIITGNRIVDNIGPVSAVNSGAGGGLCIMDASGEMIIDKNIFTGNEMYNGGGLYFRNSLNTKVTNNIFEENSATLGGGITYYNPSKKSGQGDALFETWPMFANNVIINNEALINGGGLFYHTNFVNPVLFNSIVRENEAVTGKQIYCLADAEFLVDHCNIYTGEIYGNWAGSDNIDGNPAYLDDSCHLAPYCICVEAGTLSVLYNDVLYACPDHDIDGEFRPLNGTADIGVDEILLTDIPEKGVCPIHTSLSCYPNPVSGTATIELHLSENDNISLVIFDPAGKGMRTLISGYISKGLHRFALDAHQLHDGIYFLRLNSAEGTITKKIILSNK